MAAFTIALEGRTIEQYYMEEYQKCSSVSGEVKFEIHKRPSYPVFKNKIKELPWDKYPIIVAGGSFTSSNKPQSVPESDKKLLDHLLEHLDPAKVFFVVGHRLTEHEKYIVEHNRSFDIYSIIPAMMDEKQIQRLSKANIKGIRISTETQEMGLYKSFNYEIFERRNCVLLAFNGNSAIANLVQEARNGKGRARIFIHPGSAMLRAKAASLEGYVTINASPDKVLFKIREFENNIGTKLE